MSEILLYSKSVHQAKVVLVHQLGALRVPAQYVGYIACSVSVDQPNVRPLSSVLLLLTLSTEMLMYFKPKLRLQLYFVLNEILIVFHMSLNRVSLSHRIMAEVNVLTELLLF
jgi:hypothetical protein